MSGLSVFLETTLEQLNIALLEALPYVIRLSISNL